MTALLHDLHMHGPAFLGVICLLIFIEECGVPVPFAPGDLLLALTGLGIRHGTIDPVLGTVAVYLATVAGAMTGREVFAAIGARLLRWLARSRRFGGQADRASGVLRRGGWPAVLVARITPGLRITATEVAGLLALPRLTFLAGLLPAAALWVGVFVGVGVVLGEPAVSLLTRVTNRAGVVVLVAAVVVLWMGGAWLGARLLRERGSETGRA